MHTMWKGSISFGLVHIPIKLFSATEEKDIKMRMLHEKCHSPVEYHKVCPVCETEIRAEEIVKGYEHEPGKFIILEKAELEELGGERSKTIEIVDFVKLDEIDPIYFNRSYYIGPSENGQKAYALLKQAMQETGKIGVAKITMRAREHLAVVRVYRKGLVLETIFWPDEVRNADLVPDVPENAELDQKELSIAIQLIEQLTTPFEPEKFKDNYRTALMELIHSKVLNEEFKTAKAAPQTNIINLMEALQASIEQTKKPTAPKAKKPRKTRGKEKVTV